MLRRLPNARGPGNQFDCACFELFLEYSSGAVRELTTADIELEQGDVVNMNCLNVLSVLVVGSRGVRGGAFWRVKLVSLSLEQSMLQNASHWTWLSDEACTIFAHDGLQLRDKSFTVAASNGGMTLTRMEVFAGLRHKKREEIWPGLQTLSAT